MTIKIILVEDQKLMRIGLRSLFDDYKQMEIIAEAETAKEAIEKTRLLKPDIVLMDIGLPDSTGIDATKKILEQNNFDTKVIMLTSHISDTEVFESLAAGANGYIHKDINTELLMMIIKSIK